MTKLLVLIALTLAGCAAPMPAPKLLTEVKTVEVKVLVPVACLTAAEVPQRPSRVMKPEADVRGLAAGAVAELREWELYYAKADALLRSCVK